MKHFLLVILVCFLFVTEALPQSYAWNLIVSGNSLGNPIAVEKSNSNNVYYGTGNQIYKSWNRGLSFTQYGSTIPNSSRVKCVILSPKDTNLIVVGIEVSSVDQVAKSTNRGQTWTVTGNFTFSFFGIPITQDLNYPDTLYTMDNARFLRSTDFGSNWTQITANVGCATPCDIEVFPDSNHIILVGDNGTGIFRSSNYGQTWSQIFTTSGEIPTIATDKRKPGVAWATRWGGGGGFLKTTDYGLTWTPITFFNSLNMWSVDVHPTFSDYICVGKYSSPSQIFISKDGGLNWTTTAIPGSNYAVYIIDTMNVFAAQSTGLYKLDAPWFVPVELISFSARAIGSNVKLLWSTATELNNKGFEVQMSTDNIEFENVSFTPGFGTSSERRLYESELNGLKAGKYYFRLAQIDYDGTINYSNTNEVEVVLPKEFSLSQNFPNPFNPSTKIQYSIGSPASGTGTQFVTLKIFDVLGNEVAALVYGEQEAGKYEVEFNSASGILHPVSGVYFYTLRAGDFLQTRKMLLLK